jgi:peptide deformylase
MAEPTTEVVDEQELEPGEGHEERREPIDPERAARRAAALQHVRRWGDPVLKSTALPIERFDDELRAEVATMADIMEDAIGVGLAATQLGTVHRLFVYRVGHDAALSVVINPEFEWRSKDKETYEEGCLSIPGVVVDVERPIHVRVRAQDEWGDPILIEASGLEARVIQHEADHLDGVLILDRASRDQRKEAVRALREAAAGRNGE